MDFFPGCRSRNSMVLIKADESIVVEVRRETTQNLRKDNSLHPWKVLRIIIMYL